MINEPVAPVELRTDRLLLRQWRDADREPFAALNDDPEVMRHFPDTLDRAASDAMVDRLAGGIAERGWGLWATEVIATGECIGFVGLSVPGFDAPFMPAVEVGWRLGRSAWGHGYATEAARASVTFGFDTLGLDEIVAMIVHENVRSEAVARRLGMTCDPADDFTHPRIPPGRPGHRCRLFRLPRPERSHTRS